MMNFVRCLRPWQIVLGSLGFCAILLPKVHAESTPGTQVNSQGVDTQSGSIAPPTSGSNAAVIVRDPRTGRLFRQQIVSVSVPTVEWESKPVTQTVYEPQLTVKNVPTQQTIYTPVTQVVIQPKVVGLWNPFRQPVMTYEYKPVTTWVPQTQTVSQAVTSQQWVPKQQTVYVPQPVQKMQTQQQLVQTEIPQPTTPAAQPLYANVNSSRAPLVSIPLLARQRMLPWPAQTNVSPAPLANVANGLRPVTSSIARLSPSNYSAPMRTASSQTAARDGMQTGMTATVLR
ncbi:MAG: hypothetical protein R3C53_05570 [Pirellulaceae bacterium]